MINLVILALLILISALLINLKMQLNRNNTGIRSLEKKLKKRDISNSYLTKSLIEIILKMPKLNDGESSQLSRLAKKAFSTSQKSFKDQNDVENQRNFFEDFIRKEDQTGKDNCENIKHENKK
jgi:hypothetical protein